MKKIVTLADVANAAGVSKTAASMALFGGAKTIKVSQKTSDRIRKAAQELNYSPNRAARALGSGKTHSIGIMFGGIYDLFHMELAMNIQQRLLTHGYVGISVAWNTEQEFDACLRSVLSHGVDGIITAHSIDKFSNKLPIVLFKKEHQCYDYVKLNKEDRVKRSVAYLASLGHKKIGYVNDSQQTFIAAMEDMAFPLNRDWIVSSDGYFESGIEVAHHFMQLPKKPTAIIARNDMVAMAMISTFQKQGIMIPRDISIIGYNNITMAQYVAPMLTTFDTQLQLSAKLLVDTMMTRLQRPETPQIKQNIDLKLIIRDSCIPLDK